MGLGVKVRKDKEMQRIARTGALMIQGEDENAQRLNNLTFMVTFSIIIHTNFEGEKKKSHSTKKVFIFLYKFCLKHFTF
jgi:hypothetical protein